MRLKQKLIDQLQKIIFQDLVNIIQSIQILFYIMIQNQSLERVEDHNPIILLLLDVKNIYKFIAGSYKVPDSFENGQKKGFSISFRTQSG